MKSKYSEEQIAAGLWHVEAGVLFAEVTRKLGFCEETYLCLEGSTTKRV